MSPGPNVPRVDLSGACGSASAALPRLTGQRAQEGGIRLLHRAVLAADDDGTRPVLHGLEQEVVHLGEEPRAALVGHQPAVVPPPGAVVLAPVEALERP